MLHERGVLVSVPAADIVGMQLPGSVFAADKLVAMNIPEDLKDALRILQEICNDNSVPCLVVARPEMFTNGSTLEWLQKQVVPIVDHICLSDGRAVRVIPGFKNHVFFFRLGLAKNRERFIKLQKRCPELFGSLGFQINSAFVFPPATELPTIVVQPASLLNRSETIFLPFCLIRHSVEATIEHIGAAGKLEPSKAFGHCKRLIYIPLTEVALLSEGFCRLVASKIAGAFFDPSLTIVVVLPQVEETKQNKIRAGIATLAAALRGIPGAIPAVPSSRIVLASDICPVALLTSRRWSSEIILHDSVDAWSYPPEDYQKFERVIVTASRHSDSRERFRELMHSLLSREPDYYWLEHAAVDPHDTGLAVGW